MIVSGDAAYVIDCGNGVARQLAFAGVPLTTLRHVFVTHQHSDHNADYGNLVWLAWTAGLRTRVDTWGPPPLDKMTKLFFEMNKHQTSAEDAGRVAQEAGVKTLVLSHFVPPDDPEVTDAMWLEAATRHFRGTVIVGRDLLEV